MTEIMSSGWGFGIVVAVCLTALILAAMGFRVRAGTGGISTHKGDDKPEPVMPERYARYTIQLIEHSIDHNNKLRDLWPGCLAKQMRVYEEREITIQGMLLQEFGNILYAKGVDEDRSEDEMSRFRAHITSALGIVKSHIRESFRNNHYYQMEEAEWTQYMKEKAKTITDIVSNELTKFWRSPVVSRAELRAIGQKTKNDYEQISNEVMRRVRAISIEAYQAEQEEKARYHSLIAVQTGIDIAQFCR